MSWNLKINKQLTHRLQQVTNTFKITVIQMTAQPPHYRLLPVRPSAAQSSTDALVSGLWYRLFPQQCFGRNHRMDQIFIRTSSCPEIAIPQLCPFYFNQVTYVLPTTPLGSGNLQLQCFNSWADLKTETQRPALPRQLDSRVRRDARPSTGIHLSRLCQLQKPKNGRSLSTRDYIYLMYGSRC